MLEMDLEECCHICDAPDEPNSTRCKSCISSHRLLMKDINKLKEGHPIRTLALELITKARTSSKKSTKKIPKKRVEDIIKQQRINKNYSSENKNFINIKEVVKTLPKGIVNKLGRTNPKKPIKKINLESRLGEEIKDEYIKNKRDEKYKILDELDEFLN